jgi:DNA helicase IV
MAEDQLHAIDVLDQDALAKRHRERDHRTVAERAEADREWTYGHIVVDEAQELSELDWRVVLRHCPSRSITIVGDLAQRESPAGVRSWAGVLGGYVGDRWTYRTLTVNYRMPAELMAIAAGVLALVDPALRPPISVRHNGTRPWSRRVAADDLPAAMAALAAREAGLVGAGSVAVLVPPELAGLTAGPASVLTAHAAKGLEFDAAIIVEPQRILADPAQGPAALYVALTRPTQRLGVLHTEPLPAVLAGFTPEHDEPAEEKPW